MEKLKPEDFAERFELTEQNYVPIVKCEPLTIWVPTAVKAKYDLIQSQSKYKFGKFLKEVVRKSIESVAVEKKAS